MRLALALYASTAHAKCRTTTSISFTTTGEPIAWTSASSFEPL